MLELSELLGVPKFATLEVPRSGECLGRDLEVLTATVRKPKQTPFL